MLIIRFLAADRCKVGAGLWSAIIQADPDGLLIAAQRSAPTAFFDRVHLLALAAGLNSYQHDYLFYF